MESSTSLSAKTTSESMSSAPPPQPPPLLLQSETNSNKMDTNDIDDEEETSRSMSCLLPDKPKEAAKKTFGYSGIGNFQTRLNICNSQVLEIIISYQCLLRCNFNIITNIPLQICV